MTYKTIAYTSHALDMLQARGVTRRDVRTILATGASLPDQHARGAVYHEKWLAIEGRNIGVVYVETSAKLLIITVEILDWQRRGP